MGVVRGGSRRTDFGLHMKSRTSWRGLPQNSNEPLLQVLFSPHLVISVITSRVLNSLEVESRDIWLVLIFDLHLELRGIFP
jgi:hypothetical protein